MGRLAVDKNHQSKGLGVHLMMHAFKNTCMANDILATQSMIVDAIDESLIPFYHKFNFRRLDENQLRLFLPLFYYPENVESTKYKRVNN